MAFQVFLLQCLLLQTQDRAEAGLGTFLHRELEQQAAMVVADFF